MPYNLALADRLRESLSHIPKVKEKVMFSGVTFMVNGKMCISVSHDELLCRVGPEVAAEVAELNGVRQMMHSGRVMKAFVYVSEEAFGKKKDFEKWVELCLDFNTGSRKPACA